jgi:hypothetical protein
MLFGDLATFRAGGLPAPRASGKRNASKYKGCMDGTVEMKPAITRSIHSVTVAEVGLGCTIGRERMSECTSANGREIPDAS